MHCCLCGHVGVDDGTDIDCHHVHVFREQLEPKHFYTSALATASFLSSQQPSGSCYVIGEPGLISALYDAGMLLLVYK